VTDAEKVRPYAADVEQACSEVGADPFLLAAIGLRESGLGWAPGYKPQGTHLGYGDGGHGFGLFQIDDRSHALWLATHKDAHPLEQARYALLVLGGGRNWLKAHHKLEGEPLTLASLAAYNCGPGNVSRALQRGLDADSYTANHNYGHWVLLKSHELRDGAPDLFPGAKC
jgi:hypothetical protein